MSDSSESEPDSQRAFELVSTMLQCSFDNMFGCIEESLLFSLAFLSTLFGAFALQKILKDRNKILDFWDKVIVIIALIQLLLLTVLFGFHHSQIIHYSIRILEFVNSVLVCFTVFCIHELSETARRNVVKFLKVAIGYAFALWFFRGFIHKTYSIAPYNCMRIDYIIISSSSLLISSVQVYVTLNIISSIQANKNQESGYPDEVTQNYSKDDGENRRVQLTGLMIGNFLPSLIQFCWDYIAHSHSSTLPECNTYFFSGTIFTFLLFFTLKVVAYLIAPWSIFFVFYWKNREYINTNEENPTGQLFFDRRSELLEKRSY